MIRIWICIVKTTSDHLWVKIITTISWRVCQRHIGNLSIVDQSSIIIMLPSCSLKTMTSRNAQCRRFYMDYEQNGGNLTRQIINVEAQLDSLLLVLSLLQGYSPSSVTWELLRSMSSIISWVGLVSFSLTLHTSWLFLATFDSVHVQAARINQCPSPSVRRQVELMTTSRKYIFLRNYQPTTTFIQGFQKQNEKHSKQNMHFGWIFQGFKEEQHESCHTSKVYKYSVASCWSQGAVHCRLQARTWMWALHSGSQHLFL